MTKRKTNHHILLIIPLIVIIVVGCEKNFDLKIDSNKPQLIVEGYINNEFPLYNYVVLSKSIDYYNPSFELAAVSGAAVYITEGESLDNQNYQWDNSTRTQLKELTIPGATLAAGIYFDPRIVTDSVNALKGKPGKSYLLEISEGGKQYSSITTLLQPVIIDSLNSGFHFIDEDDGVVEHRARITINYRDPDTIGNTQLFYWQHRGNRDNFGWGGLGSNRFTNGTDDLVNGQYIRMTQSNSFVVGDTVRYSMASVERKVFNFWDSYIKARNNGGPFATPVMLSSTIKGEDVIGCFSGLSLSSKTIIVR